MKGDGMTSLLFLAAVVSMTGALPVQSAGREHSVAASLPLAVVVTPPRHLPHSPVRQLERDRYPSVDVPLVDPSAHNFISIKHAPRPADEPMGTLSLSVPILVTLLFALIVLATMGIAHCLYRRYARNLERAFGIHHHNNQHIVGSHAWRFSSYNDVSDDGRQHDHREPTEHDRLLGAHQQQQQERRRSTSYYDANRSRSAAPVVIQTDMRGRPVSTWSTASSVAAQRGEELSRWSRRRDELIAQYGQGNLGVHPQHYDSLAEEPEGIMQEEEEREQDEDGLEQQHQQQAAESTVQGESKQSRPLYQARHPGLRGEYSAQEQAQLHEALQQLKQNQDDANKNTT